MTGRRSLIVLLFSAAFAAGCASSVEPTLPPTSTPVPTATFTPTPTPSQAAALPTPASRSYDAVFVRWDDATGGPLDLQVVAVTNSGHERTLRYLQDAEMHHTDGAFEPRAAASLSGLLVYPRNTTTFNFMRWWIADLSRPDTAPRPVADVGPDYDQLAGAEVPWFLTGARPPMTTAMWGPGSRLAILWTDRRTEPTTPRRFVAFVDGRTGETTNVEVPGDKVVQPYWASDGSGVFVEGGELLRSDGSLVAALGANQESICRTRDASGVPIERAPSSLEASNACLSPDDSALVVVLANAGYASAPSPRAQISVPSTQTTFDVGGAFAGWLEVVR